MTSKRPIVLFGLGGVAGVIRTVLDQASPFEVVACTVNRDRLESSASSDLPLVAYEEVEQRYPPGEFGMFVAVGYSRVNAVRAAIYEHARGKGYELVSWVSDRTSTWPGFETAPNTIVMEDCTIGPGASIGEDCIIWPRVYVGHGSTIGAHSYLAANASISGFTRIGPRCVIGSAAVVRDDISVGEASIVGVGAVLTKPLEANSVVAAPLPRRLPGRSDRIPRL